MEGLLSTGPTPSSFPREREGKGGRREGDTRISIVGSRDKPETNIYHLPAALPPPPDISPILNFVFPRRLEKYDCCIACETNLRIYLIYLFQVFNQRKPI